MVDTLTPSFNWCKFCSVPPVLAEEFLDGVDQQIDPAELEPEQMDVNAKYAVSEVIEGADREVLVSAPGLLNRIVNQAMERNELPKGLRNVLSHCVSCQLAGVCESKPSRKQVDVEVTNGML